MQKAIALLLLCVSSAVADCNPGIVEIPNAKLATNYGAYNWACNLNHPRSILAAPSGEILVVESGRISCLYDDNANGYSDADERVVIITQSGLNHGIALTSTYIYASSTTTVWRWALSSKGIRTPLANPEVVVTGIPSGGHSTRGLAVDSKGTLYVQCGSGSNVDSDPSRSLIRSFDLSQLPSGGFTYTNGGIFAIGLRNEVGIRFDSKGGLWGVENGVDNVFHNGVDIHNDNPGEEINYFGNPSNVAAGTFYGYPYCYSTFNLAGYKPGTQLAHPQFPAYNDSWCQDTNNVALPAMVLPAHVAPLDLIFVPDGATDFPGVNAGDMFVSSHGSWDRDPAQGYNLYRVAFTNGKPSNFSEFFAFDSTAATSADDWPYRPVGLAWNKCKGNRCLLLSSDATGQIFSILPTGDVTWSSQGVISSSVSFCLVLALSFVFYLL